MSVCPLCMWMMRAGGSTSSWDVRDIRSTCTPQRSIREYNLPQFESLWRLSRGLRWPQPLRNSKDEEEKGIVSATAPIALERKQDTKAGKERKKESKDMLWWPVSLINCPDPPQHVRSSTALLCDNDRPLLMKQLWDNDTVMITADFTPLQHN